MPFTLLVRSDWLLHHDWGPTESVISWQLSQSNKPQFSKKNIKGTLRLLELSWLLTIYSTCTLDLNIPIKSTLIPKKDPPLLIHLIHTLSTSNIRCTTSSSSLKPLQALPREILHFCHKPSILYHKVSEIDVCNSMVVEMWGRDEVMEGGEWGSGFFY